MGRSASFLSMYFIECVYLLREYSNVASAINSLIVHVVYSKFEDE